MKALFLLMIFTLMTGLCLGQRTKTESHLQSITLEGLVGINRVESLLQSPRYFNNYTADGEVSPFFGLEVAFRFRSNLVFQSGLKYMTHNTKTDSLNIPPVSREDIWSAFIFEFHSINIPLRLGYDFRFAGNSILLRPQAGIVLRFLGGHHYSEMVTNPDNPANPGSLRVPPAELDDFEKFGVGMEAGLTLILLNNQKFSPFINGAYFRSSTNFKLLRGYNSNLPEANQAGEITEKGLLISAGIRLAL